MTCQWRRFIGRHALFVLGAWVGCSLTVRAGDFVPGGPCTRGRVKNNGTTIVTDWDTRLRGPCWCQDCHEGVFDRSELVKMKYCGLNVVHVYGEKNDDKPVGVEAENIDSIVEWCRQESVYVILTFGGSEIHTQEKVNEFWRFYAPRYADQTHVIYEPKNEGEDVVATTINWYGIIREYAPDTHLLLGSYSNLAQGSQYALRDINGIGDAIDWSNESIAFHGYLVNGGTQEKIIHELNAAGYATTITEFPNSGDLIASYERAGVSYIHFEACWSHRQLGYMCDYLKQYNVSWQPDFGDWPQEHVEHPAVQTAWDAPAWIKHASGESAYSLIPYGFARGLEGSLYDVQGKLVGNVQSAKGCAATHNEGCRASQVFILKPFSPAGD
jgi:endoglucanase